MAAETPPTLSDLTQTHADADQPSRHDASSQVILDPAQEDEFLTALEVEDFESALQIVPKSDLLLLRVGPDNLSLLRYACQHGRDKLVRALITKLDYNSDLDCEGGLTPLHVAAREGHLEIVQLLVQHERSRIQRKQTANSALLEVGVSSKMSVTSTSGNTPLHIAAAHGHLAVVKFLTDEAQYSPVSANKDGHSPLHLASLHGHLSVVKYLVSAKELSPSPRDEHGRTPLYLAAGTGQLDVVRYLISNMQCDPIVRTTERWKTDKFHIAPGRIPLHTASREGHLNVVQYLVNECGCDIMHRDDDGVTALHLASQQGHLNVVKYLIDEQQADPSCLDEEDCTPLHLASMKGSIAVVRFLSEEKGCDPLCRNKYNDTPLHSASLNGRLEVVKFFIAEKHCDPMCRGQWGRTPLHQACENGHLDVVKYLLIDEQQADPSCLDEEDRTTPLHLASMNGHVTVVRFLSEEKRCDPLCRNKYGSSPVHDAALHGRLEVVKFFITEKNCDPMCRGRWGRTPLHGACQNGHLDVVKYLIDEQQADPSCLDEEDRTTPLHLASVNGHVTVVRFLSEEKRCDPLCRNKYNNTPLHMASLNGRLEVVKFFITEKNCDPMCRGRWGRTPLHGACQNGHLDVVKYLIDEQQADPSCLDMENNTPLHFASVNGHLHVIKFLIGEKRCNPSPINVFGKAPINMCDKADIYLYLLRKGGSTKTLDVPSLKLWFPIHPFVKIFVTGNSGSGKSTLVKALQNETASLIDRFINVSSVPPETAGIIPNEFTSKRFGQVIIYDLAGHEEYHASHELVFKSVSNAIVLVTVDLRKSTDELKRELAYWQLLVTNAASGAECFLRVIPVGSHADTLSTQEVEAKTTFLSEVIQSHSQFQALQYKKGIMLDCRKSSSKGMSSLREVLEQSCKSMRIRADFDHKNGSYLKAVITKHLTHTTACTFSDLLSQIRQSQNADVEPLKSHSVLFHACKSLNTSGHLMFLKNEENETDSWIIFKKEEFLSKVHGLLKHPKLSNKTGVLALSQLENALKNQDKYFSIDLAIRYMKQMTLCIEIDLKALNQIEGFETTSLPKEERYFFFPTLISEQQPSDIWKFNTECYLTGWCLTCTEPWHFFTPRFLQLLLISLARQFALVPQPQGSRTLLGLSPGCKLWKNGIRWLDADGIETVVEVTEQSTNVVVMMWCLKGSEMSCIKHRSSMIQQVLQTKDKFCSRITPKEYLLHPHCLKIYPMQMLSRIPMLQVAKSILQNHFVLLDNETSTPGYPYLPIEELLFFEPYHCLGIELLKEIFNPQCKDESAVPESIIDNLSKCMAEKWRHLACTLQVSPFEVEHDCESHDTIQKCRKTLALWKESSSGTFGSLRRDLSNYSIFAGRNPLELYPELIAVAAAVEVGCKATDSTIATDDSAQVDESVLADPRSAADVTAADVVDQKIVSLQDQKLAYLPGLNPIGQTQIAVHDGQAQSFEWRGYGLKLFIPNQTLSSGVDECLISIQAGLSGQFTLPQQYSLVSAVYGITVTAQFAKPVTLEIEHCADCNSPDDCEDLTFAVAKTSTQEPPYSFEVLPGGVFTPKSSHGSIRVQNFSLIAIFKRFLSRTRYCAQLFYVPVQPTDWRLYFVVTRDLEAEAQRAAEMYPKRERDHDMKFEVQFGQGQSNIQLDVPCEGSVTTPEGWNIIAPYPPQITKERVDGFRSSTFRRSSSTPSCELHIRWDKNQNPPFLNYYKISLIGTQDPNDYFRVSLNPGCDSSSTGSAGGTGCVGGHEILNDSDHFEVSYYLFPLVKENMCSLGLAMGLNYTKLRHMMDSAPVTFNNDVIAAWLRREDGVQTRGVPSWRSLVAALRDPTVGQNGIAGTIAVKKGLD